MVFYSRLLLANRDQQFVRRDALRRNRACSRLTRGGLCSGLNQERALSGVAYVVCEDLLSGGATEGPVVAGLCPTRMNRRFPQSCHLRQGRSNHPEAAVTGRQSATRSGL